jgi:hypothetical protein
MTAPVRRQRNRIGARSARSASWSCSWSGAVASEVATSKNDARPEDTAAEAHGPTSPTRESPTCGRPPKRPRARSSTARRSSTISRLEPPKNTTTARTSDPRARVRARTDDAAEDDGWIMSYVCDASTDMSDVVILHAQDFTGGRVATIHLPQCVPFGFHGNWIPDPA